MGRVYGYSLILFLAESYFEIKLLKVKVFVHLFQKVAGLGRAQGFDFNFAESEAEPKILTLQGSGQSSENLKQVLVNCTF